MSNRGVSPFNIEARGSRYRHDIDGLRAVAILPVLLVHAHVSGFGGGYVGVDVFFVISGYLITGIVAREVREGRFSLSRFYERRVRRIFPALIMMLAAVAVAAYLSLLPEQLEDLSRSFSATTLFGSNIFFYRGLGYFDGSSDLKPLLHTWSLGVEEQFYIFFPLYLAVAFRLFRARIVAITALVAVASLAFAVWATVHHPKAAFYLAPFRAHELLLGALVSLGAFPPLSRAWMRHTLSLAGVGMIVWAVVGYSIDTSFPGLYALVPCVGAALVIHAGVLAPSAAGRLLSWRPLVLVGLISYSLYLWHWPLLVFARIWLMRELDWRETAGVIAAAIILSVLSWRYIEGPFRRLGGALATRRQLFAVAGVAMVGCLAFGRLTLDGAPWRFAAAPQDIADLSIKNVVACVSPSAFHTGRDTCIMGDGEAKPLRFVVWGDSHALALFTAIDAVEKEKGKAGRFFGLSGCPPVLDVRKVQGHGASDRDADCMDANDAAFRVIVQDPGLDEVLMVARWPYYFSGRGFGEDSEHRVRLFDRTGKRPLSEREIEDRAARTIAAILAAGKAVRLIETVPEFTADAATSCGRAMLFGGELSRFDQPRAGIEERDVSLRRLAARFASDRRFTFVATHDLFCSAQVCRFHLNGRPLYTDNNHIGPLANPLLMARISSSLD